jgi:hypothetical protein
MIPHPEVCAMRFRPWIVLAVAIIAFFALARSTDRDVGHKEAQQINQEISDLERRWQRAVVDRDRSALDSILGESFAQQEWASAKFGRGTDLHVVGRQEYLDEILKSEHQNHDLAGEIRVVPRNSATAFAGLRLMVSPAAAVAAPPPSDQSGYDVDVLDAWVRTADGWRVSARQVTAAAPGSPLPSKQQN